jgi:hypothetical protein
LKHIEHLQNKMVIKILNEILEQRTNSLKIGLGFDPYAYSKTHAPTVVKYLGNGKIEILNEPKKIAIKYAGIMSSTSTMNANVASTSQAQQNSCMFALIVVDMDIRLNFALD